MSSRRNWPTRSPLTPSCFAGARFVSAPDVSRISRNHSATSSGFNRKTLLLQRVRRQSAHTHEVLFYFTVGPPPLDTNSCSQVLARGLTMALRVSLQVQSKSELAVRNVTARTSALDVGSCGLRDSGTISRQFYSKHKCAYSRYLLWERIEAPTCHQKTAICFRPVWTRRSSTRSFSI